MSETLILKGIKVVIIDDSNTIRRSGQSFLAQAGCEVILSEDGLDGIAKVAANLPDVVFVDVMMPRLDGYQTCSIIKRNQRLKHIPVIILTNLNGLFDRARGQMSGANHYLNKPFNKQGLIDMVVECIQRKGDFHEHS